MKPAATGRKNFDSGALVECGDFFSGILGRHFVEGRAREIHDHSLPGFQNAGIGECSEDAGCEAGNE